MTNVVEQIMHPHLEEAIEKLEAAHRVEMGELREEMQGQIDDLEDKVNRAAEVYDEQYSAIDSLLKTDKEGKPIPVSMNELKQAVSFRIDSHHNDWDLISVMSRVLDRVRPEIEVVERTRTVYEVPAGLRALVRDFHAKLDEYL